MKKKLRSFPLHFHIWVAFALLVLGVGTLVGASGFVSSRLGWRSAASDLSKRISNETMEGVQALLSPAETAVRLVSHSLLVDAGTPDERLKFVAMLRDTLEMSPALHGLYIGYANGDFFVIQRLLNNEERTSLGAPTAARYIVQSIAHDRHGPHGFNLYLDSELRPLAKVAAPDYARSFDVKRRPWYREALSSGTLVRTDPYLFYLSEGVGATFAMPTLNRQAVVGADLQLETLGQLLTAQKATDSMILGILDAHGHVLARGDDGVALQSRSLSTRMDILSLGRASDNPVLAHLALKAATLSGASAIHEQMQIVGRQWYLSVDRIAQDGGKPLVFVLALPLDELLKDAKQQAVVLAAWTVLLIFASIPLAWLLARLISRPMVALAAQANAIRQFDFSETSVAKSSVREVNKLAHTLNGMRTAIRRFLDITRALTSEPEIDRLLPLLVRETMDAAASSTGALYLITDQILNPAYAWSTLDQDITSKLTPMPLADAPEFVRRAMLDAAVVTPNIRGDEYAESMISALVSQGTQHVAAVPLIARDGELVGVMLLLREAPLAATQLAFVGTLAGLSANVLEMRGLARAQRELFDAFIQLIAGAIDAKNPHTGGHCARVPALVKMIAQAACDAGEGPFAAFSMSDAQWEELHVAAWLHDCGKITTPEYVIDKATKLETIYDRIHELRMRFEVLKRDAVIDALQATIAGEDAKTVDARCEEQIRELDAEFALVAECNLGAENVDDAKIDRLRQIAKRTWLRTLDDRIGISQEELARKQCTAAPVLPVVEPLLADKAEHLISRGAGDFIADNNPWGFKVDVPELLYHRGELYSLSVARGTLCREERYKIEEHIVQTQMMLSRLPFPKHLRDVPEIAGNHHEAMDGTGYPRRLTREEMSIPARMMAIADVFEALTAKDRPYKRGKTLSESIRIMASMKARNRIDPDLFDLFLRSGAFLRYAKQFMAPEQIDDVDVSQYLVSEKVAAVA